MPKTPQSHDDLVKRWRALRHKLDRVYRKIALAEKHIDRLGIRITRLSRNHTDE